MSSYSIPWPPTCWGSTRPPRGQSLTTGSSISSQQGALRCVTSQRSALGSLGGSGLSPTGSKCCAGGGGGGWVRPQLAPKACALGPCVPEGTRGVAYSASNHVPRTTHFHLLGSHGPLSDS